jgi:hypothetical protein
VKAVLKLHNKEIIAKLSAQFSVEEIEEGIGSFSAILRFIEEVNDLINIGFSSYDKCPNYPQRSICLWFDPFDEGPTISFTNNLSNLIPLK